MKKRQFFLKIIICLLFSTIIMQGFLFANKSDVEISVPTEVKKGDIITIKLKVIHKGNNFFHYTDVVTLKINGDILKKWEFSSFTRPENEVFTREITYTVNGPVTISAVANCNLHGSIDERSVIINVK